MTNPLLTYAGHSAWFITLSTGFTVAIDPWLEGNPLCPSSLKHPSRLDLICLTHGHADHASDAVRLHRLTKAKLCATWELCSILAGEGIDQDYVVPMNKGGTVSIDELQITLTDAKHSSSFDSPTRGTLYAGEACGVVVSAGESRIYHAGDTLLFGDMSLIGELWKPTTALLPIGDRFTMDPQAAARAASLIRPRLAMPMHFATFPLLTGTPEQFQRACQAVDVMSKTLQPGESCAAA